VTDFSIVRDWVDRPFVTQNGPLEYVKGRKTPVNAEPYTRISTMARTLDSSDGGGMRHWIAAHAMLGVIKDESLYQRVSALSMAHKRPWYVPEGKKPLKSLAERAMDAGGANIAREMGTAFHQVCETRDKGDHSGSVSPRMLPWVEAREAALEEFEPVLVEPFVVCDEIQTAGSPDRYLRYKGIVYAADDKTGTDEPDYPLNVTVQVAIAAHSCLYDQRTGERTPIDCDQERGILIHTPIQTAGPRCVLYWLDLVKGWELAQMSYDVREARKLPKLEKVA
jgi:hypothetical protein